MILMGNGRSKQRHKAITEQLIHSAFIAVDFVHCQLEKTTQEPMHRFSADLLGYGG